MLGAQANQRGALGSSLGWMRRLSPVDEERYESIGYNRVGVSEAPGQQNAVGLLPSSGKDLSELHALALSPGN